MCAPLAVSPDRQSFVLQRVIAEPSSWARTLHVYSADGDFSKIPKADLHDAGPGISGHRSPFPVRANFSPSPPARLCDRPRECWRSPVDGFSWITSSGSRFMGWRLIRGRNAWVSWAVTASCGSTISLAAVQRARTRNTYDDDMEPARCQPVDGRGAHAPPRNLITRTAQDGRVRFYFGHEKQVVRPHFRFDWRRSLRPVLTARSADGRRAHRVLPFGLPAWRPLTRCFIQRRRWMAFGCSTLANGFTRLCDVERSRAASENVTLAVAPWHTPLAVLSDGRVLTQDRQTGEVVVWLQNRRTIARAKAPD